MSIASYDSQRGFLLDYRSKQNDANPFDSLEEVLHITFHLHQATKAILCLRNRSNKSTKGACTVGPTKSWSFSDVSNFVLVDVLKTTCICGVVLDGFITVCMGM